MSYNLSPFRLVVFGFAFVLIINLLYLDWFLFLGQRQDVAKEPTSPSLSVSYIGEQRQDENSLCPQSCVYQIQEATASLKLTTTPVPSSPSETKISVGAKEFFIPFGSGSSSAGDWEDIEGLQVYIDSKNYEGIKKATFEASVRIPTGNQTAYVRLFNKTDKHPVWFSEVSISGGTPQLLISESIILDEGNKLYQVQMKTQLKFLAILDQARVHIITQ